MAQPTPYEREFNFSNQQAATPSDPIPAPHLDAELNRVKLTLDEILANLAAFQDDEGDVTIGYDQLDPEVLADLIAAGVDPGAFSASFEAAVPGSTALAAELDALAKAAVIVPITLYGATSGSTAAATKIAIDTIPSTCLLRSVPAGVWRCNALSGTERVTWIIDPGATFPDLPTIGPYGQTNLSVLGGRIIRLSNNTTTKQGIRFGSGNPWPETYRPFSVAISEVSAISVGGQIGISGYSRSSDMPTVNQGTIGGEFIAINDDTANVKPVFGAYKEAWRTDPAVGTAIGTETDVIVLDSTVRDLNPNTTRSINSKDSIADVYASGGEIVGAQTASAATATWSNGAKFWRGHVIMAGALDVAGSLEAYAMPGTYKIAWHDTVGGVSYLTGRTAQWISSADADASGIAWNLYRRKADGTSDTDTLDAVFRTDFYGYLSAANYAGGFLQFIQRTSFSASHARFSWDMQARNSDGSYAQVSLNGAGNNVFSPMSAGDIALGTTALPWKSIATNQINLVDGITAPATVAGVAQIYVDVADGDLKVKFGDGTVKTIVVDT